MGSKGIPKTEKLILDDYRNALFTSNSHYINLRSLRVKDGLMRRTKTNKKGLSDIFVKYRVEEDGITCSPLSLNGKIL